MVTPLARRRPWTVARETVTLDHLSQAAVYGKPLLAGLLALSAARAFLAAAWNLGGGHALLTVSGATAVAIAGFALYGGLALLLEDLHQREVLPILRVGAARRSFEGGLHEQLERVEGEAGVRQQL